MMSDAYSSAEPADERHCDRRLGGLDQSQLELGQRRTDIVVRGAVPRQVPDDVAGRRHEGRGS